MAWSKEKILKLIEHFQQQDCLWNVLSEDYKNQNKKKEAWNQIAIQMEVTVEEIERKMRSILAQYRRQKNKLANARKIGNGAESLMVPKWFAYDKLTFLHGINKIRSARRSLMQKKAWEQTVKIEDEEDEPVNTTCTNPLEVPQIVQPNESFPVQGTKTNRGFTNRKVHELDTKVNKAYNIINTLLQRQRNNREYKDEYDAFGAVVASKIRKLGTSYEKNIVQFKINTLLFQAEMGEFKATSNQSVSEQEQTQLPFVSDSTFTIPNTVQS